MTLEAGWRALSPGTGLPPQRVRARNLFATAANRIHDDTGARQHGFAGALVAGVTVFGYLSRLVVAAWGPAWLERGTASVRFLRPVYDRDELALEGRVVARSASPAAGEAALEVEARGPAGDVVATLIAGLAWGGPVIAPDPSRYRAAPLPASPPPATATALAALDPLGSPTLSIDAGLLAQAAADLEDTATAYRGPDAVAHPALVLRQANRALAENVRLGPWLHAASDLTFGGLARAGDRLETRGRVARVYERKGRGWVDLELVVLAGGASAVASIRHTAVYRLPVATAAAAGAP